MARSSGCFLMAQEAAPERGALQRWSQSETLSSVVKPGEIVQAEDITGLAAGSSGL